MAARKSTVAAARTARAIRQRLKEDLERFAHDAGVSQRVLAASSGVPQSYVSRILAGSARPSIEVYARLATALGSDLTARIYPNTGPAIRDRLSVPILETILRQLHPRWQPFTEVAIRRPARGWIDVVLYDQRDRIVIAGEIETTVNRIEQLVRWTGEKAESLPSWDGWSRLPDGPTVSRLLVVRWTRSTRAAAREAERQLRVAYPGRPADALGALTGVSPWPGPALVWARRERGEVRLVAG